MIRKIIMIMAAALLVSVVPGCCLADTATEAESAEQGAEPAETYINTLFEQVTFMRLILRYLMMTGAC